MNCYPYDKDSNYRALGVEIESLSDTLHENLVQAIKAYVEFTDLFNVPVGDFRTSFFTVDHAGEFRRCVSVQVSLSHPEDPE